MTDYSKWDQLSNEIVQEEENEKIRKRNENKAKYYKEQQEKQMKYMKEHPEEFKQNNHNHEHNHDHSSHDGHSHNDSHSDTIQSTSSFQSYRPKCGCGYANPEELLKLSQEKAKEPVLSAEEKNKKKWNAVLATKEHGKILFTEQKYKEAFSVYERGVLICTGMYGDLDVRIKFINILLPI